MLPTLSPRLRDDSGTDFCLTEDTEGQGTPSKRTNVENRDVATPVPSKQFAQTAESLDASKVESDAVTPKPNTGQQALNACTPESKYSPSTVASTPKRSGQDALATPAPSAFGLSSSLTSGSLDQWNVGPRYKVERVVGHGSYGQVAEALDLETGQKVAIKYISNVFDQEVDTRRILREVKILRHLRHENVIRLLDITVPDATDFNEIFLIFEFVDTDLQKLINSPQYLTIEHVKAFLYQLLCALKFIHASQVIHRDIKPANILLNEDCGLKVCDFGLARVVPSCRSGPEPALTEVNRAVRGVVDEEIEDDGEDEQEQEQEEKDGTEKQQVPTDDGANLDASGTEIQVEEEGKQGGEFSQVQTERRKRSRSQGMPETSARGNARAKVSEDTQASTATRLHKSHSDMSTASSTTHVSASTPQKLVRTLTKHVITRWYRPPELILLQDYTNAVDVWSVGCLFAELLGMQKESIKSFKDRTPLFPGKSCFPLSADHDKTYKDRLDQLNVIFGVIGTPAEHETENLGEVKHYLRGLAAKPRADFGKMFKAAPPDAIELLDKMLVFDPQHRISVEEALAHPFLLSVRNKALENIEPAEGLLNSAVPQQAMDPKQLKQALIDEVREARIALAAAPSRV